MAHLLLRLIRCKGCTLHSPMRVIMLRVLLQFCMLLWQLIASILSSRLLDHSCTQKWTLICQTLDDCRNFSAEEVTQQEALDQAAEST